YPDWSPDGTKLVFIKPSAGCQQQLLDIGQTSIFVYGGSLVTVDWNGSAFSNEQVMLAAQGTDNNYYPSWSPDGGYIAFTRADGSGRQRAGGRQRAARDLDHRDRADRQGRGRLQRSVVAGGVVPVPGPRHEKSPRRLVAHGRGLLHSVI